MSVHKDKERKTWYVCVRYTDWQGERRTKKKRGFKLEREAKAWEAEFLRTTARSCDMSFESMVKIYLEDMEHRLKAYTMKTKRNLINSSILPFFGKLPLDEITPAHVRKWHNELMKNKFAPTYLKTLHAQLSAVFNYAGKFYGLRENPARIAGSIGSVKSEEPMKFWVPEEFERFIAFVEPPQARVGFMVMFWSGLRVGELLALCPEDIDLDAGIIHVTKSIQIMDKQEVITPPKTKKSRRDVPIPKKLCAELRSLLEKTYQPEPGMRIFPHTKTWFYVQMEKGSAAAGLTKIRLHDLRHSYASMLINNGVPVLQVSELLGHENIETTLNTYSHLYKKTTEDAVKMLNLLMK